MKNEAKSLEECLAEAAECDRLAGLARSEAARRVMTFCATAWRRRAEEAKRVTVARIRKSNWSRFRICKEKPRLLTGAGLG